MPPDTPVPSTRESAAPRYPKPPLGRVPVLPPTHVCEDHEGDRFSGEPCPNCVPISPHEHVFRCQDCGEIRA